MCGSSGAHTHNNEPFDRKPEIPTPCMVIPVADGLILTDGLRLPILKDLFSEGFDYGVPLVVEYQPHSLWYETTLTIAAHALRNDIRTDYHTYMHSPDEVKADLKRLGLDPAKLEEGDLFRIVDSYSVQVGAKSYKSKASGLYTESMDVTN